MTPRERSAETKRRRSRERLLEAARFVMRIKQLDTRVEDIATHAGVSAATFYNIFTSLDAICEEVFWDAMAKMPDVESYRHTPYAPLTYLSHLIDTFTDDRYLVRAVLRSRVDRAVSEMHEDPVMAVAVDLLRLCMDSGMVASDDEEYSEVFEAARATALLVLDSLAYRHTLGELRGQEPLFFSMLLRAVPNPPDQEGLRVRTLGGGVVNPL